MTLGRLASLDQINDALKDRCEELCGELLGGKQVKGEWIAASTEAGGIGDSLSVGLRGSKRGKWYHFATGLGGDLVGLVNYARFNNADMKRALAWSKDFIGGKIEPETEKDRELRLQRQRAAERKEEREERARQGKARFHFLFDEKTVTNWEGTPAWHYLNNRLGGRLAKLGHLPGCIRFHPALYNAQLSTKEKAIELPAMIAAVVNVEGSVIALHRTWLVKRGAGDDSWDRLRKEDLFSYADRTTDGRELKGKKVLGSFRGGTIRLWAGRRVHMDTGEVKLGVQWPRLGKGSSIMLCEGIETGLSLALAMPERRIVTTISIDGFADVVLPPCFDKVTIAADRDDKNERQKAATSAAIERAKLAHASRGRQLQIVYPPEDIDDWNTALRQVVGRVA